MIPLSSKQNVISPNSTYPYGAIKDNPGDGTGTPVNTQVYGDFHQFFAKLFADSGLTANGLADNASNGFQLFEAFITSGNINFVADFITGVLGGYTTNDLIVLWGCSVTANIGGTSSVTAGAIFYNNIVYKVDTNASISSPTGTLVWKIDTSVQPNKIYLANGTSGSGIADYNASNIKYAFAGLPNYKNTSGVTSQIPQLRTKIIEIGDWNMLANNRVTIAHGLNYAKIRKVTATIVNDFYDGAGNGAIYDLNGNNAGETGWANRISWNSGSITLDRADGGNFDNTVFDSTSFNRGWIIIEYQY